MLQTTDLRPHFDELSEKMWTTLMLPPEFGQQLRKNAKTRLEKSLFRKAELSSNQIREEIRNDKIFWLDDKFDSALLPFETEFLGLLDQMRDELKNQLRVGLRSVECHYAIYEPGHFYRRHRDTTSFQNQRVFSFVFYLNDNWGAEDGGELKGYTDQTEIFSIRPELGRLILFRSDLEHEVKPTRRDRLSLTGWFRT